MSSHSFAYLFERFPSFTQTFCTREVIEMQRQGMSPLVFSIREKDEQSPVMPADLRIEYLPNDEALTAEIKASRHERKIPRAMELTLREWSSKTDKHRVYAAAWLGPVLKAHGIRHVHAHFAGIAARSAYWLKKFYGITYSFTGHANDIFCETDFPVSLANLVREAAFVATETEYSRNWLQQKFPEGAGKIKRVYNGIDFSRFQQASPEKLPIQIISVGRYIEKKGFGDLIEACRLLHEKGREFSCSIVGEGPMEEELQNQISSSGLADTVKLTGPKSQEQIIGMLADSSMFVLPCVPEKDGGMDNLPTVIMEAMGSGLPVVSTRLAGIPEMVEEGETGLLVEPHQPAAIAGAMETLMQDAEMRATIGHRGRERAVQKFSAEATTRSLTRLLVQTGRVSPGREALQFDPELRDMRPSFWQRLWR